MPITPITATKGIEHSRQVSKFYTELDKIRNIVPSYKEMATLPQQADELIIKSKDNAKAYAESVKNFYTRLGHSHNK